MQKNTTFPKSETRSSTHSKEATMKRSLLAAIMAAFILTGTLPAQAVEAPKVVVANNGAPVSVYFPLAGEHLVLLQDIVLWKFVYDKYTDINGKQVPEAISELAKKDQESVESVTALFASTARFAKTKGKEYSEQLSTLIGFEDAMKQLGCFRSDEASLAQVSENTGKAKAEESNAIKAADELQKQVEAKKADPQFVKVEALKAEIAQLKTAISLKRPKGTPKKQFATAKQNNKNSLVAKEAELKTEEPKLEPLNKEVADLETKLEAAKAELKTKSDAATQAEAEYNKVAKAITWSCKDKSDEKMLSSVEQFVNSDSVSKPEYAAANPFIQKAKESTDSSLRALNVWAAISRLNPNAIKFLTTPSDLGIRGLAKETASAKVPAGEPRINLSPDGASVDITSKPGDRTFAFEPSFLDSLGLSGNTMIGKRLLNKSRFPWWNKNVPPLHLSLTSAFFSGDSTDTRHGRDFTVSAKGYSVGMSLGVEGVIKQWKSTAMFYGADLGLGYRKTNFRDETVANSVSSSFAFGSTDLRMGVNFKSWASVYALTSLRLPLGGAVGGGLGLTGLGSVRIAVEGLYDLSRNNANTGVAGSHPADFSGPSIRTKIGLVF